MAAMLDEVSEAEEAAGRGMLTVIVVHKAGDMQPGPGFFDLAKRLGRNTSDIVKCWVEELKKGNRTGIDAVRDPSPDVAVRGWKDIGPSGGRSGSRSSRRAATQRRSLAVTA